MMLKTKQLHSPQDRIGPELSIHRDGIDSYMENKRDPQNVAWNQLWYGG